MPRLLLLLTLLGLTVGTLAVGGVAQQYGGVFRVAMASVPSALDMSKITADETCTISNHVYEFLFSPSGDLLPRPMLVASYEYGENGAVLTMHLRQGVLFHNGEEMDSEDVVASLNRWLNYGSTGGKLKPLLAAEGGVAATDKYTVVLRFIQPVSTAVDILAFASGGCPILPKEIADVAGKDLLTPDKYIGTGPYKFLDNDPGRVLRLVRFEDYVARDDEPSGHGGRKTAYFDEIDFYTVPESATRLAGLRAGDYDFASDMSSDLYDQLNADPAMKPLMLRPAGMMWLATSRATGPLSNPLIYEAIMAALDMDEVMALCAGSLGGVGGSIFAPGSPWYTLAGSERYNQADPDRARQLMTEAGYKKEPIRFLTSSTYDYMYNASMSVVRQLTEVGFNIDLKMYDWATVVSLRDNTDNWDLLIANHGGVAEPSSLSLMSPAKYWKWTSPEIVALKAAFNTTMTFEGKYAIWEDMQTLCYDQNIIIPMGYRYQYHVISAERIGGLDTYDRQLMQGMYCDIWFK
jgi:peptide/nickel transport system substrate-binding protein